MFHHDLQEFDDDFGYRADEYLTMSTLLGVGDGVETLVQNRDEHHLAGPSMCVQHASAHDDDMEAYVNITRALGVHADKRRWG